MKYVIGRPIGGIALNGNEYLLDDNGDVLEFDSEEDCLSYITEHITDENPEDYLWED